MFKKASEIKKPIRALIYGEPGSGKTTLLGTLPSPITIIDFEGGASIRLRGRDDVLIAEVSTKEELEQALKELEKMKEINSVAFDGFSVYLQARLQEIVKENPGRSGGVEFKHWNRLFREAKDIILRLRKPSKHLVFTALEKTEKDERGEIRLIRPDLPVSIRRYLRGLVDLEGRLWDYKGKRIVSFKSNEGKMEVKDRTGIFSAMEPPDFSVLIEKVYRSPKKEERLAKVG